MIQNPTANDVPGREAKLEKKGMGTRLAVSGEGYFGF